MKQVLLSTTSEIDSIIHSKHELTHDSVTHALLIKTLLYTWYTNATDNIHSKLIATGLLSKQNHLDVQYYLYFTKF